MLSFLILALACVASAQNAATTDNTCDLPRQKFLNNFFYIEKERQFAAKIALAKETGWLRQGQLFNWRQFPLFFEEGAPNNGFSFFFYLAGNFTGDEAWMACQRFGGGYLASLHTQARVDFVNKFLVRGGYWFGLSRWDGCDMWQWSTGFSLGNSFTYWTENQPSKAGQGFDCVRSVDPASLNCSATGFCTAKDYAGWTTENCDTSGFGALCETPYAKPFYGMIQGNFDFKGADAQCKAQFGQFYGAGLAQPNSWYGVENLIWETTIWKKGWECWIGNQRFHEKDYWKHQWLDGSWATRFSYQPRFYGRNYSMWTDSQTCVSLSDPTYSLTKGYDSKAYYNYNECSFKLSCAICQWFYPLA